VLDGVLKSCCKRNADSHPPITATANEKASPT